MGIFETAIARLFNQFDESENILKLLSDIASRFEDLSGIVSDLLNERGINSASGIWLDNVGEIVGMPRPKEQLDDSEIFTYTNSDELFDREYEVDQMDADLIAFYRMFGLNNGPVINEARKNLLIDGNMEKQNGTDVIIDGNMSAPDVGDWPAYTNLLTNNQSTLATTTIYLACPAGNAVKLHWGDGSYTDLTCDGAQKTLTHDYAATGTYIIGISGNFDKIISFKCYSQTFIGGDIAALSPLVKLVNLSLHTTGVTGTIASLSPLVKLVNLSLYSTGVTGDIASLAPLVKLTTLYLNATGVTYSTMTQPVGWKNCTIWAYSCGWSTVMVDQMLIDHDAITMTSTYTLGLRIAGTNAAHTNPGAAEDARVSLLAKGKTPVEVN